MSVTNSPEEFRNGMATAALVFALIGLGIGVVPFVGILGIPFAVIAIPLGIAGKRRSLTRYRAGYGRSVAALVIAGLSLAAVVVMTFSWRIGEVEQERKVVPAPRRDRD